MPIKIVKRYTRKEIQANPNWFYVFGDNYAREGFGGQALAARGEPNAIGICTKKAPTYDPADFFTDHEYMHNISGIVNDFKRVFAYLALDGVVVWPEDGIGTGIADLQNKAPHTLKFIENLVDSLKQIYGVVNA